MQVVETDPRDRVGSRQPIFPDFKPLEMRDRAEIEAFTSQFDPYSDFCFSTLIFYNSNGHTRWCWLDGNLVLHLNDGFGPGAYFTLLWNQQIAKTAKRLIDHAMEIGCSPVLRLVPEIAEHVAREKDAFHITPDQDCFDYVYLLDSLARMEGPKVRNLRYDVNLFKRRHPHHRFVPLDLHNEGSNMQLLSAISVWQSRKGGTDTLGCYCRALEHGLRQVGRFRLVGIAVFVEECLAGFAVGDHINKDWLLSHFAAADPKFNGLSSALLHHFARRGLELGCTHLNYQEDLGDSGLRRFKMKCAPSGFLRKFSVKRKESAG